MKRKTKAMQSYHHRAQSPIPLDDLPDTDLATITMFSRWLRLPATPKPWPVAAGSYQHHLAKQMQRAGLATIRPEGEIAGCLLVELIRQGARP